MAIKIKDKGNKLPEEDEETQTGGGSGGGSGGGNLDGFERASFMAAAWIEENRGMFFTMIGVALLAGVGIVIGIVYVRSQQLEASERLSEGLAAYEVPVEGSPDLEAIRQQEDIPEPPDTFESSEERWNVVYESAASTLEDFDGGAIAVTARMTKAAAALNLGNYEEAASLYREVVESGDAAGEVEAKAYVGLANSSAALGNLQEAEEAWGEFGELMPERRAYADFELARLFERHGEPDEARQRYEQFIEEHADSEYLDEVERRKALL